MILNISENTDIVQFFTPWMMYRFEKGVFGIETDKTNDVYNIKPKNAEMIIFQTKNPKPILPHLDFFNSNKYNYFFIVTINGYDSKIEKNIDKSEIFKIIQELSQKVGKEKIIWKYSPVFLNSEITEEYHYKSFKALAKRLAPYVSGCILDFIKDFSPAIHVELYAPPVQKDIANKMYIEFKKICNNYKIQLYIDGTKNDVNSLITSKIIQQTGKAPLNLEAVDMGLRNTCPGECQYCCVDGNKTITKLKNNVIDSPVFMGSVRSNRKLVQKRCKSIFKE